MSKKKSSKKNSVKDMAADTWEKLEQVFESRVARVLNAMQIPTHDDVQELSARVEALTHAVEKLGGDPGARSAKRAGKKTTARKKRSGSKKSTRKKRPVGKNSATRRKTAGKKKPASKKKATRKKSTSKKKPAGKKRRVGKKSSSKRTTGKS